MVRTFFSYNGFEVMDGVLLRYSGKSSNLIIPSVIRGQRIKKIATGAFFDNSTLISVKFEEGIETIGENAFVHCSQLRELELPTTITCIEEDEMKSKFHPETIITNVRLTNAEYEKLVREGGINLRDGRILIAGETKAIQRSNLICAPVFQGSSPEGLDARLEFLLCQEFTEEPEVMRFVRTPEMANEDSAVKYLIQKAMSGETFTINYENINPSYKNLEPGKLPNPIRLSTFDKKETLHQLGTCIVRIRHRCCQAFYPFLQPVCIDGRPLYIYQREYFSGKGQPYKYRQFMEVYSEKGGLTDSRDRELAIMKYNFMSMLG